MYKCQSDIGLAKNIYYMAFKICQVSMFICQSH